MSLKDCYNFEDFRKLAKKNLPAPIFHYIDGGSDDETTLNRNTAAFNDYDLIYFSGISLAILPEKIREKLFYLYKTGLFFFRYHSL